MFALHERSVLPLLRHSLYCCTAVAVGIQGQRGGVGSGLGRRFRFRGRLGHLHAAAGHGLHHLARVVELLLRAAMSAPSARNRRPWAFIVVDNKALLRQLADSLPYAQSAAAAPMAVVVCGVLTESQGATNAGWWVQDAAAASENLLLAAHAVGLGRLSGRACIPPRIACVPSATCWGFPAASCRST